MQPTSVGLRVQRAIRGHTTAPQTGLLWGSNSIYPSAPQLALPCSGQSIRSAKCCLLQRASKCGAKEMNLPRILHLAWQPLQFRMPGCPQPARSKTSFGHYVRLPQQAMPKRIMVQWLVAKHHRTIVPKETQSHRGQASRWKLQSTTRPLRSWFAAMLLPVLPPAQRPM